MWEVTTQGGVHGLDPARNDVVRLCADPALSSLSWDGDGFALRPKPSGSTTLAPSWVDPYILTKTS